MDGDSSPVGGKSGSFWGATGERVSQKLRTAPIIRPERARYLSRLRTYEHVDLCGELPQLILDLDVGHLGGSLGPVLSVLDKMNLAIAPRAEVSFNLPMHEWVRFFDVLELAVFPCSQRRKTRGANWRNAQV